MGDSNLRIEGYAPGYQGGGAGLAFAMPKHSRAQRMHTLFAAIEASDMDAAQHALTAVLNFDPHLAHEADFAKLVRAVHERHAYAAQHFAHEYQSKLIHAAQHMGAHLGGHEPTAAHAAKLKPGADGLPHIDTLA